MQLALSYPKDNVSSVLTLTKNVLHAQIQIDPHAQNVRLVFIFNQINVSSVKVTAWLALAKEPVQDVKPDIIWPSNQELPQVFANLVINFVRPAAQPQLNAHHALIRLN